MPNYQVSIKQREIADERWLEEYYDLLGRINGAVLELGSGRGRDTGYLLEHGPVTAIDINPQALIELKDKYPLANTVIADLGETWPVSNHYFSFVLASLSLHYFSDEGTRNCISELRRVLEPTGTALLRFNSTNDVNYGARSEDQIEVNYYNVKGQAKRFFSKEMLEDYFSDWDIEQLTEVEIDRYLKRKTVWELVCTP